MSLEETSVRIAENEECFGPTMQIRSKGGKMRVYLAKAMELLRIEKTDEEAETRSSRRLTLVGRGDCVYRAISVGEMLKRSLSGVSLSVRLLAEEDPSQKSRLPITTVFILVIRSLSSQEPVQGSSQPAVGVPVVTKRSKNALPLLQTSSRAPVIKHPRRKLTSYPV